MGQKIFCLLHTEIIDVLHQSFSRILAKKLHKIIFTVIGKPGKFRNCKIFLIVKADMIQNFLHCRKAFILLCTYRNNIMPGQHFIKEIKEQHFQLHIKIWFLLCMTGMDLQKNFLKLLIPGISFFYMMAEFCPVFHQRGYHTFLADISRLPGQKSKSKHHTFIIERIV